MRTTLMIMERLTLFWRSCTTMHSGFSLALCFFPETKCPLERERLGAPLFFPRFWVLVLLDYSLQFVHRVDLPEWRALFSSTRDSVPASRGIQLAHGLLPELILLPGNGDGLVRLLPQQLGHHVADGSPNGHIAMLAAKTNQERRKEGVSDGFHAGLGNA